MLFSRSHDWPLVVALAVFVATWVLVATGASHAADVELMYAFQAAHDDTLTVVARVVTTLGGVLGAALLGGVMIVWLITRGEKRTALWLFGALFVGALLTLSFKAIVARPRPDVFAWLTDPSGWSFPSGHSANIALVLPLVAGLVAARTRSLGWVGWVAAFLVIAVGLSRCYLGVHWPSDVLAGWALGFVVWRVAVRGVTAELPGHEPS